MAQDPSQANATSPSPSATALRVDPGHAADQGARQGRHEPPSVRGVSGWRQFADPLGIAIILALLAVIALAWTMGERKDAIVLLAILLLRAAIGLAWRLRARLGRLAPRQEPSPPIDTPLQLRLSRLGTRLTLLVLVICALVFTIGLLRGEPPLLMTLTALALAAASLPGALPAVAALLLAATARRMAQAHALVQRWPAVEALASISTLCADKTGTLTQNRMQVASVHLLPDDVPTPARTAEAALWRAVILCNDARARLDATNLSEPQAWVGDPTETALVASAASSGRYDLAGLCKRLPRVHEWPFEPERKRMSTLHPRHRDSGWLLVTKGAPESVLPRCSNFPSLPSDAAHPGLPGHPVAEPAAQRGAWMALAQGLASQGLRVLAFAQRRWSGESTLDQLRQLDGDQAEAELELLGLIGLIDPLRPEAGDAVAQCHAAGIRPVMITGDHPATALTIARQLGIVEDLQASPHDRALVLTGPELARLSDAQLAAMAPSCRVYPRVDPAQKLRIVTALQSLGHQVAMTGDGLSDAPALQRADIGVAMGGDGSDAAREAAALVLLDDRFATLVTAVREGRRFFDNLRKILRHVLTGHSALIWLLLLAMLPGLPLPLLPSHILWIGLLALALPGMALAGEAPEPGVMHRPPRPPHEALVPNGLWQTMLWMGLLMGALALAIQAWGLATSHPAWQTMVLTSMTLAQLGHLLAIRSETDPVWKLSLRSHRPLAGAVLLSLALLLAVIYLPPLQALLHTQALSPTDWGVCTLGAFIVVAAVEFEKYWRGRPKR